MGDATGFRVMRLARLSFAGVGDRGPARRAGGGTSRADELATLKKDYGVPKRVVSPPKLEAAASPSAGGVRPRPGAAPKRSHARPEGPDSRRAPLRPGPSEAVETRVVIGAVEESAAVPKSRPESSESSKSRPTRAGPVQARALWAVQVGALASGAFASRALASGAFEVVETGARHRESGPRYGGGSPGRRGFEVREDWGGGAQRSGGQRGPGRDGDDPPRGDVGGRGGRTRTTGSGGGVGAGAGSYRIKGRHG